MDGALYTFTFTFVSSLVCVPSLHLFFSNDFFLFYCTALDSGVLVKLVYYLTRIFSAHATFLVCVQEV